MRNRPSLITPRRLGLVAVLLALTAVRGFGSATPADPVEEPWAPSEEPPSFDDRVWRSRVDAALAPSECSPATEVAVPPGSYAGMLIDTHFHMPHIPDSPPGAEPGESEIEGFGDGGGDWEFEPVETDPIRIQQPLAGKNITNTQLACLLRTDGTDGAFAFFPVFEHIQGQLLDLARRTMEEHGDVFVPFIMPPGPHDVQPTVDAVTVSEMVSVYPGLFQGYGEMGLYEIPGVRGTDYPPDAQIFQEIYPVVREHGLMVYFHPGSHQRDNLANALEANPDISFIVHGDQIEGDVAGLMDRFPNIYYPVDAIYGDQYLLRPEETIESFLAATSDFEPLLEADLEKWKTVIEEHPDRFMWGTDRGGSAVWTYDLGVSLRLAAYGRAFIGGLDPDVQERFAYGNAARLIADG
ncbi:MAG: amidohydrolase family protein [Acidimicrobiia bacterium]